MIIVLLIVGGFVFWYGYRLRQVFWLPNARQFRKAKSILREIDSREKSFRASVPPLSELQRKAWNKPYPAMPEFVATRSVSFRVKVERVDEKGNVHLFWESRQDAGTQHVRASCENVDPDYAVTLNIGSLVTLCGIPRKSNLSSEHNSFDLLKPTINGRKVGRTYVSGRCF